MAAVAARTGPETKNEGGREALYGRDFHAWTVQQGAALRAGRLSELDRENLAEEIESLGREQFSKLRSGFRIILLHMSKWDRQPEKRSRSWTTSIANGRFEVEEVLDENPSLRLRQDEAVQQAYRKARLEAADETGLRRSVFPTACPYTLDDVLSRPFEWPED